jgi:1,2-beta-oligoglucan phosphorylase
MVESSRAPVRVASPAGLSIEINENGSLGRIDCETTLINSFLGNEIEGGPANIYLRRAATTEFVPLLGPRSPTVFRASAAPRSLIGDGRWQGLRYEIELRLAADAPAWFWHVRIANETHNPQRVDLIHAQDLALAPYDTVRMNEYYVSQYVDHTPLDHAPHGVVIASRQNLPAAGRHPWSLIGSMRKAVSYATDALQFHGLATRAGTAPVGLVNRLSGRRLQHEHSMVVLQDETIVIAPGAPATAGFFGLIVPHHPAATDATDLAQIDRVLALPEAQAGKMNAVAVVSPQSTSVFVRSPLLMSLDLSVDDERALFGPERRHEEVDTHGKRLSFFTGAQTHVVLRSKELHVERPHGHLLRTGREATPDERALTSTVWMNGVFNSMLTQGHVSFNRLLSTTRSYLSLFRSHGQRVFVELNGQWHLLDLPSAFAIRPDTCRWIYRHAEGLIEVAVTAHSEPHAIALAIKVLVGEPARFLITHHIALNDDDGASRTPAPRVERRGNDVFIAPAPQSELQRRFPGGGFLLVADGGTQFEEVADDALLFEDRRSRGEPFVCLVTSRTTRAGLKVVGQLVSETPDAPTASPKHERAIELHLLAAPPTSELAEPLERLADIMPWFSHNAFIHYLSPRGLEQYTGGGWGTRDVTQGPVELLLSAGHSAPIRDLLLRVMRAQKTDGDWPQWFMFFERERSIRAGDSHGDIVFWPVLALAQYLIASADASVLDERVPFFEGEQATVWEHAERALALIERRVIHGTALAAYGHGDWNDALQPADPSMREHMCSAWTVTLHHQVLTTLARALRCIGRAQEAPRFDTWAEAVRENFQRLLVVDGVLAGYALFASDQVRYLLHPRDALSGVRYSSLAMIHALLEDLFTPEQAREHLRIMDEHLLGPDGIRLFDRPMPYHGGPQRFFQRAESATFFGREIGLMYMHAHLRYAQALARMGEAERFFKALCQANPLGIRSLIPQATLRQANCYYSSSDAAFEDRYQASTDYHRIKLGRVGLDGGWRVYSSGAGIALGLIVRRFLGLNLEADALSLDPVIPAALSGLRVELTLWGQALDIVYEAQRCGCGVTAIELNGKSMSFARESNPYRAGAVRIAVNDVRSLLGAKQNLMRVRVG